MNEMEYRERIIIWGAGTLGASRLLCELLEMKYVIFAYCDSDDNKCGMSLNGYMVKSINEVKELSDSGAFDFIVIAVYNADVLVSVRKTIEEKIGTNVKVKAYAEIRDELENSYIAQMQQNMDFSGYEINYPKQFNIWINNIMSEVDFWVNSVAKENSQCREDYCKRLRNNRFRSELVGNAEFIEQYLCGIEEPLVYDIGCGLAPRFGETLWNGNKISLVEIDPLAYFYNVINEKFAPVHDCRMIIFGMFEYFSDFFDEDSADVVIINNALDHCIDPYKSIVESLMVLKPGGVLHLNHARAEGIKGKYTGLHQWNLDYTGDDDFIIWNYDAAVNVTQRLKDIADIKLGYAGKNASRSQQYVCVDMIKKRDFDKAQYVDINYENKNKAYIMNRLMQALSDPAINSVFQKMLIDACEAEAR